jgi:murein DD-endopeptidase MepM/ murein hydrolase activator NlpD
MTWPTGTPQDISQYFGEKRDGYYTKYGWIGHNGLDVAVALGTPVKSIMDCELLEATAKDTGYGLRVTTWSPILGLLTVYGHFQKIAFPDHIFSWTSYGHIKEGDVIGYVDSTGDSTGNHLHLGIFPYLNQKPLYPLNGYGGAVNPLSYLMNTIIAIKLASDPTVYVECGGKWIPLGTDWNTFKTEYPDVVIKEFSNTEWQGMNLSKILKIDKN